jgi:hypothetical protein
VRTAAVALAALAAAAAACSTAQAFPTCSAHGMSGRVATQGITIRALIVRSQIASYATGCDYERLEELGREHGTFRFGPGASPSAYWRREEALGHKPLGSLVKVLQLPHATLGGSYVWPAAAKGHPTPSAWNALVGAGVLSRAQAAGQRAHGNVYTGWRVVITSEGDWLSFTSGH